jgi:hypothetical protein
MIDFLPGPRGPFALAQVPEQLLPGRRLRAGGLTCDVVGSIVCVDSVEAWLECLLRSEDDEVDDPALWLAVEVRGDRYRTTLWERTVHPDMPEALRQSGDVAETLAGTASFRSMGRFGAYPIPTAGLMTYRESRGVPATAAEQFVAGGPWLVGRGDGADIELRVSES